MIFLFNANVQQFELGVSRERKIGMASSSCSLSSIYTTYIVYIYIYKGAMAM